MGEIISPSQGSMPLWYSSDLFVSKICRCLFWFKLFIHICDSRRVLADVLSFLLTHGAFREVGDGYMLCRLRRDFL